MSDGPDRARFKLRKLRKQRGRRLSLVDSPRTSNVTPIGTHPLSPIRRFGSHYQSARPTTAARGVAKLVPIGFGGADKRPAPGQSTRIRRRLPWLRDYLQAAAVLLGALGMFGFVAAYIGVATSRLDSRTYLASSSASLVVFVVALLLAWAAGLTRTTTLLRRSPDGSA